MPWIVRYMRWIMLLAGVLTATMIQAAVDPVGALQSNFGETPNGPAVHLVIRNWGALIASVGGMLIYGAFRVVDRPLILTVAGSSKLMFIALVLSNGTRYFSYQAGIAIAVDSMMVVLFAWYLLASRSGTPAVANRQSYV